MKTKTDVTGPQKHEQAGQIHQFLHGGDGSNAQPSSLQLASQQHAADEEWYQEKAGEATTMYKEASRGMEE